MAKKLKPYIPKRRDQTEDNQWLQKQLFKELPLDEVTPESQLYLLQRTDTGGGVYFRPVRVTLEDVLAANVNVRDEGNANTVYLLTETFDEEDANATSVAGEIFTEGAA